MHPKSVSAMERECKSLGLEQVAPISVLAVGDPTEWKQLGKPLQSGGMVFISFEEVSETVLAHYNPSVVVSPVLTPHFDCIELALLLHNLGYTGSYRAMVNDLPKPELIVREVSQMCPRLKFSITIAN